MNTHREWIGGRDAFVDTLWYSYARSKDTLYMMRSGAARVDTVLAAQSSKTLTLTFINGAIGNSVAVFRR
jgi:hypothetical protein